MAGTSLVAAWGFGRFAKEASAGTGCDLDRKFCLRKERREALAPAPATEKSAPYDSERSARAPRPGHLLALPSNPTHGLGPPVTEWLHNPLDLTDPARSTKMVFQFNGLKKKVGDRLG